MNYHYVLSACAVEVIGELSSHPTGTPVLQLLTGQFSDFSPTWVTPSTDYCAYFDIFGDL